MERVNTEWGNKTSEDGQKSSGDVQEQLQAFKAPVRTWQPDEMERLKEALYKHGRNWVAVSLEVKTRSNDECRKKACYEIRHGRWKEPKIQPTPRFRTTGGPPGASKLQKAPERKTYTLVRPQRSRASLPSSNLSNLTSGVEIVFRKPTSHQVPFLPINLEKATPQSRSNQVVNPSLQPQQGTQQQERGEEVSQVQQTESKEKESMSARAGDSENKNDDNDDNDDNKDQEENSLLTKRLRDSIEEEDDDDANKKRPGQGSDIAQALLGLGSQ